MKLKQQGAVLCTALFFLSSYFLTGCHSSPKEYIDALAKNSSLDQPLTFNTDFFTIVGWGKNTRSANVNIYIEGDGQSWEDPWTISNDPSPPDPMSLRLALVDNRADSILYLARPCQYTRDKRCTPFDWTSDRFGPKVIQTYTQILNQIKATWPAKTITLHGYSGGATVVLLLAADRNDIISVVTFAPLLDPYRWATYHHYSPLAGSLSPLSHTPRLMHIPQTHFIGLEDTQVPYSISANYFAAVPPSQIVLVHKVPDFTHHSDWPQLWKSYILKAK